jgi:hypothetical protein
VKTRSARVQWQRVDRPHVLGELSGELFGLGTGGDPL